MALVEYGPNAYFRWPETLFCSARRGCRCLTCTTRHNLRRRAGALVAGAIRRGDIQSPHEFPCADCGCNNDGDLMVYDHRDYEDPLKVEPVCQGCNVRRGPGKPYPPWHRPNETLDSLRAV